MADLESKTLGQTESAPVADQVQEASETAQPEAATPASPAPDVDTRVAPHAPDVAPEAAPAKAKVARAKKAPKATSRLGTSSKASDQSAHVSPEIVVSVCPSVRCFM